ncbi:MAG: glycosyltransferase family 2 protein, partial [Pseudomonadota bacterium]
MTSVTLCVPAWQSEDTVGRAIESALGQTHGDTRVLISVDESQDGTAEVCRRYAGDPRVELVVHDRRLGWAGNVNFCLGRIETDAVAMVFHDDWVEPHYCEVLTGMLEADPETIAVTGAVAHHGDISRTTFFEDAVGPLYDRLLQFFKRPQSRYTLKAMHRAQVFRDGLRLQDDGGAGFQIDVPFSMHVLLQGAFRKTDEVLYRKRMDASSVSAGWRRLDADEYFARQVEIRARLVEILAMTPLSDAEKMSLTAVILSTVN